MKDRTNNHKDSNVITMSDFTASQRNAEAITTPAGEAFLARTRNSHMDLNELQAKLAADRMPPEEVHSFFSREVENSRTLLTEDRKDYEPSMNQAYFIVDAMGRMLKGNNRDEMGDIAFFIFMHMANVVREFGMTIEDLQESLEDLDDDDHS